MCILRMGCDMWLSLNWSSCGPFIINLGRCLRILQRDHWLFRTRLICIFVNKTHTVDADYTEITWIPDVCNILIFTNSDNNIESIKDNIFCFPRSTPKNRSFFCLELTYQSFQLTSLHVRSTAWIQPKLAQIIIG